MVLSNSNPNPMLNQNFNPIVGLTEPLIIPNVPVINLDTQPRLSNSDLYKLSLKLKNKSVHVGMHSDDFRTARYVGELAKFNLDGTGKLLVGTLYVTDAMVKAIIEHARSNGSSFSLSARIDVQTETFEKQVDQAIDQAAIIPIKNTIELKDVSLVMNPVSEHQQLQIYDDVDFPLAVPYEEPKPKPKKKMKTFGRKVERKNPND